MAKFKCWYCGEGTNDETGCFRHKPRKAIKRITEKQKEKNVIKAQTTKDLHEWFKQLWDEREDENGCCYCFETGVRMHRSVYRDNSCVYSHCYAKSPYPQYAKESWNVLIVTPDSHTQWGSDMDKTPKMKEYYLKLKEKMNE